MPRDGTETYEKILPAAKEEFLEKGKTKKENGYVFF